MDAMRRSRTSIMASHQGLSAVHVRVLPLVSARQSVIEDVRGITPAMLAVAILAVRMKDTRKVYPRHDNRMFVSYVRAA